MLGPLRASRLALTLAAGLASCSGPPGASWDPEPDASALDAPPDPTVLVGPLLELPLLMASPLPDYPLNASAEVTIAAKDGVVVAAYINLNQGADFEITPDNVYAKTVGVAVSPDRGESFMPVDPGPGAASSDPVVRVAADGTFWLATIVLLPPPASFALLASSDHGDTWETRYAGPEPADKEWLVIDDAEQSIYLAGERAFFLKLGFDGGRVASWQGMPRPEDLLSYNMSGGYVDGRGAHFLNAFALNNERFVLRWDGSDGVGPTLEGHPIDKGDAATILSASSASIGLARDGSQWIVHGTRSSDGGTAIVVRVRLLPEAGEDVVLSEPGHTVFMPAAVLDSAGLLHVIFYDSTGPSGTLLYTRSRATDLRQGFLHPVAVDPDACPGRGWFPRAAPEEPVGQGRRLREYVDITVDGDRAHLAWTHAPQAPARVYATWIEPE